MQSPTDFVARWTKSADNLKRFPNQCLERLSLSAEDKSFLEQAGLPADAAPFLSFDAPASGNLPTVTEQWDLPNEFQRYRVIGSDGAGSPVAIDEGRRGEVVCLDQENRFARVLMNTSIARLAESLLAYRKLVEDTQAESGLDAFLDGKISKPVRDELRRGLMAIDPAAMQPGCFWHDQLKNLDANAGS